MKILYRTKATATGGRDGHSRTEDGKIDVKLDVPTEMGGGGGEGTNPEQLFAAGYSACFLGAMKAAAGKQKVTLPEDAEVTADVGIGPRDDGEGFGIDVELTIDMPGVDKEVARRVVDQANIICPYSHATKGNVDVRLKIA